MHSYLLLWFTQMISGLGSAMTAYALVIWPYGNMHPKLVGGRAKTLGRGDEYCDFKLTEK